MIKKLEIKNFKSIKDLKLKCSRVNIFIGEPNTGKSNILESIGILSFGYTGQLKDFVRYERISNLFYNNLIGDEILINYFLDKDSTIHEWEETDINHLNQILSIRYSEKNQFEIESDGDFIDCNIKAYFEKEKSKSIGSIYGYQPFVRFFRNKDYKIEKADDIYVLKPPDGRNLMNILFTNEDVRKFVADTLGAYGFRLILDEGTGNIHINKQIEDYFVNFPFSMLSDTFIKISMYYAAIESSKKHTIILEEPEAHVFPFYNKFLAERIALFNTNQFFIATHNPTFLINLIEKTPDDELIVFITHYSKKDNETKVVPLVGVECDKLLKYHESVFINLNRFYDEK